MTHVFLSYGPDETIPVTQYLRNRKLKKYFNRETAATVTAMGTLLEKETIDPAATPIYYATGLLEYEDYGLAFIVEDSLDATGKFSDKLFIDQGLSRISPLNQFKILQNVPLCFVSIEFGFAHDNAVIYSSASGLLQYALCSPAETIIIGAGKTYSDGSVEVGFSITSRTALNESPFFNYTGEAIELFKAGGCHE